MKIRRFFEFSLRQFLLLFALFAVLLGILTPQIHRILQGWGLQNEIDQREAFRLMLSAGLNTAVRTNNVSMARRALEAGADPRLDPKENLLNTSINNGRVDILELLLVFGVDANSFGGFPLSVAASSSQPPEIRCQMIRLLVARGADPRRRLNDPSGNLMDIAFLNADARTGDLLRDYGLPYGPREMAAFNRLDELKLAVEQRPEILRERFPKACWGEDATLLAIALQRGYRDLSQFLVDAHAPLNTVLPWSKCTLLHVAALGGDPELIRCLVAHGLDVNAVNASSITPLTMSIWDKRPLAIAALLEAGADINHKGFQGCTPLHSAASGDDNNAVKMLLDAGADASLANEKGETALDLARAQTPQNAKIVELLEAAVAR